MSTSAPLKIPSEPSEKARMQAVKRRERSTTAVSFLPSNEQRSRMSPVTFKNILDDSSVYSSSPDDDVHFVAEQIIDNQLESTTPSQRRVTVCTAPTDAKKAPKKSKQRRATTTVNEYYSSTDNVFFSDFNNNNGNAGKSAT